MKDLIAWKENPGRSPLVVQGVRQCGKTYLIEEFGKTCFGDIIVMNFEKEKAYKRIFNQDLSPKRIIREIEISFERDIDPKNTLIFFDEIQACKSAITSLKYFKEDASEYHIIAAGSLLGVAMAKSDEGDDSGEPSFPVGKTDFLTLYPLNFEEFLLANGKSKLVEHIKSGGDYSLHKDVLEENLRAYYLVGGMPSCVSGWIEKQSIEALHAEQDKILTGYEKDMSKHAGDKEYPKLSAIWNSIPQQLAKENRKFIFSRVKKSYRARDLEDALEWLIKAGLVHKVSLIEKPFIPIESYADSSYFKLYMCDVGLLRRLANVPAKVIFGDSPLYTEFKGAMAENFALTEITPYYSPLYYWTSGNKAEVDFVLQDDAMDIVPIEVKADKAVRAQSIASYCNKYQPKKSIVTALRGGNLPLYLLWTIKEWMAKEV
jgi:predicted AAA+ superfamily ATPase